MIRKLDGSYIETRIDGEAVLVQLDRGSFHGMKSTGLAIWELIDGTRDKDAIVTELTGRFDVSTAQCDAEVTRFLGEIKKAGFVAIG